MLSKEQEQIAKRLFGQWFKRHPGVKNPTDMNSKTKYDFCTGLGWEQYSLMQKFRKGNLKKDGYPYPWTKADYWE